jgi:hypothetical protein
MDTKSEYYGKSLSPYQMCICSNPIPITGVYIFFTLPFENSANIYLKNPQSYSYQQQTGSKVVTYSPQTQSITAPPTGGAFFISGSEPSLPGKANGIKNDARSAAAILCV